MATIESPNPLRRFLRKPNPGVARMIRNLFLATALVALTCFAAAPASAQVEMTLNNDLFAQYVTPNGPNATTAGMYPAPHYVPPMGGQAYYTYQPLMPHEMMYQHARNYYNYYGTDNCGGGPTSLNKTSVRWQSGTNHMGPLPLTRGRSDFGYRFQSRRYGLGSGGGCATGDCGGCDSCGN